MARAGWDVLVVSFDDSGGTLRDMSQYVFEIDGFDREAVTQDVTAAGDDDEQHASVGLKRVGPITIRGAYDDAASTGPDVVFNAVGNTTLRTLTVTWKSGKSSSVECVITNYKRSPTKGQLTGYEVKLQPTGAVTEV